MLAGVSAQAQKKGLPPVIQPVSKILSVQDQDGGGYMWFNMLSGEFKCNMCEYGYVINGKGEVKVDGFNVYLTAVTDEYQIFISVNIWERQGKAVMEVFQLPNVKTDPQPIQEFWSDSNIDNNKLVCFSKNE
jgi:hypothetical protein